MATGWVEILKTADDWPKATVTVDGTVTAVLVPERLTVTPPGPARPLKVTVPFELTPPISELGAMETEVRTAGLTVRFADCADPALVAVTFAMTGVFTPKVETWKVAAVCPPGTVTVAGSVNELLEQERLTTFPPGPAKPLRITVPVEERPPWTEFGLNVRD